MSHPYKRRLSGYRRTVLTVLPNVWLYDWKDEDRLAAHLLRENKEIRGANRALAYQPKPETLAALEVIEARLFPRMVPG